MVQSKSKTKTKMKTNNLFEFVVGTDFSDEQLNYFITLNKQYKNAKVYSVYGSLKSEYIPLPSARPDFRLPDVNLASFEKFLDKAKLNGIKFEYTLNGTLNKNIDDFLRNKNKYIEQLKLLKSLGVDELIVSNPLLMELASEVVDIPLKVSTVVGVNKISALKHYAKLNINCICLDIYKNRNLPFLKSIVTEGKKQNVEIELLVNEICMFGDTPCSSMLRQACYANSTFGGNESKLLDNWPFSRCQKKREEYPVCWLQMPCVLPQHLQTYNDLTGVKRFKISGRTNPREYVEKIVTSYFDQNYVGKIKDFFCLPQNNLSKGSFNPDVQKLENEGFYNKFLTLNDNCDYNCETCGYCKNYYEKKI